MVTNRLEFSCANDVCKWFVISINGEVWCVEEVVPKLFTQCPFKHQNFQLRIGQDWGISQNVNQLCKYLLAPQSPDYGHTRWQFKTFAFTLMPWRGQPQRFTLE